MIFGITGGSNIVNTPVKSMKLEVPSSAVAAYRAAAGWNEFKSIVCISHNFNQQNTDVAYAKDPVTCTKAGTYYYSCSVCGEKSTNTFTVAALQHDYSVMSTDEAYHKDDATCLSAATYWYKCSRCTAKSTKDFFTSTEDKDKALGHSYGEGVWSWKWDDEEHSATCTRTCIRTTCTDKTTGHTASAKVTQNNGIDDGELTEPATCTAMGTTTYTATATVENVEYKSTHEVADIAMLPHTFDHHVCTGCSADEEPAVTGTQGECTWRIYASDGEMIVSPTNGASGSLGDWGKYPSWYEQRTEIKSVRFTGSVVANTLFYAFIDCSAMTSIDFTNLNTSQVKDMSNLFSNCSNLTTINWGSFDTSNAHSIWYMFASCSSLTSLDLRCFNTSNVSNIRGMFDACGNLTSVDLSSFKTDKVTSLGGMFSFCYKLTSLDLSNFNTSNVTDFHDLFWYCYDLQSLTIGNFDMSKDTDCSNMFDGTDNLSTLTLTSVPYLKEGTFDTKFADKTVICQLDENSVVYEGDNHLPAITQCNHYYKATDETEKGIAATCTTPGVTDGSHCKVCNEVLEWQEEIPPTGHTPVYDGSAVAATCTMPGQTDALICSVCNVVLQCYEEIPPTGHTLRENYYVWSSDDHYYHKECQICNKMDESMAFCHMFGEYYNIEEKQSMTLPLAKVGSYYYTSISTDFSYTVNEGVEVYQIWEVEDGIVKLVKRSPDQIVGKTSVIIRSKTTSECTLTYDPYGLETNDQEIVHSSPTVISNPEPNMYVFSLSDTGSLGFWNWEGMTIPAWKPYIQIDDPSAAKGLTLVFVDEDGTTSVEQIPVKAPAAEGSYDLMGRKVKAVKGFGIVNGKKVYVR